MKEADNTSGSRSIIHQAPQPLHQEDITMSKGQHSNKEAKKKPTLTLQEKRAAKKTKKETQPFLSHERAR
ncbi:hypothetical protein [Sedimenticola hydrogenitrophicus]|uniref:hypothetical protein n=1 Tax=Sedimenticola hydrogenitrophicus TaxID=2967975 RepID=UPI0021A2EEFA|nr:hypothetical protein [Sedimenticola hydrogenitrophicus]